MTVDLASPACVAASFAVFVFGASIGSFLNVVIYRVPLGMSVAHPRRSMCPNCRSAIPWYCNIPVFSWLALRGRCRSCALPISVRYPLVEAGTGLAFVVTGGLRCLDDLSTALPLWIAVSVLICVGAIGLDKRQH
jgi:leader peptidase (prepilin peptidase)/N-methyltransferase